MLACFEGNTVHVRDVEQAYLQADIEGTPTWVVLPQELWTPEMFRMKCPVVKLKRALYGHKNSGVYWQRYCEKQCKKAGFEAVPGDNWPSVYRDNKRKLLLIVYVDDMKLAGPKHEMDAAWERLGKI